jgi:hypothetical protein
LCNNPIVTVQNQTYRSVDLSTDTIDGLDSLANAGFAFVHADAMNRCLGDILDCEEWPDFVASWNDLAPDTYLAERGLFRRRGHAVFSIKSEGASVREPHQPHYQSRDYNALQGDIERWFEPINASIGGGTILQRILKFCATNFSRLAQSVGAWKCEVHQVRIEASNELEGRPTPEGIHRDGVDYVLVLLIDRENIVSGTTTIHTAAGVELGSFTLTDPLDAALVDDERVFHGVTPVHPEDPTRPAHRDVLVVTLKRQ